MERLARQVADHPLAMNEKVLALTFMHGARRRLDERLAKVEGLGQRYECATLDSFAARLVKRWRALVAYRAMAFPADLDYEGVCETAAQLMEHIDVRAWVRASYPILVFDEAQDLTPSRLRIVQLLSSELTAFIAADEFQCLNAELRPNPAWNWLQAQGDHETLARPMRTQVRALLDAAMAVREGRPVADGGAIRIHATAQPAHAGTFINNHIGWNLHGSTLAVITPTASGFAHSVVGWCGLHVTKQGHGPFSIAWEKSESAIMEELLASIPDSPSMSMAQIFAAVEPLDDPAMRADVINWIDKITRIRGVVLVSSEDLKGVIQRTYALRRRYQRPLTRSIQAMTIHGAKNREFEHVIVLWPAGAGGDAEQKRRLLYNAITRAKRQCLILVQAQAHLQQAPFA